MWVLQPLLWQCHGVPLHLFLLIWCIQLVLFWIHGLAQGHQSRDSVNDTTILSPAWACVHTQGTNVSRFVVENVVLAFNTLVDLIERGYITVQAKLKLVVHWRNVQEINRPTRWDLQIAELWLWIQYSFHSGIKSNKIYRNSFPVQMVLNKCDLPLLTRRSQSEATGGKKWNCIPQGLLIIEGRFR